MGVEVKTNKIMKKQTKNKILKIIRDKAETYTGVRKKLTTKPGQNKIKVATLNPDNITYKNKLRDIITIMRKKEIQFLGIQETHDTNEKDQIIENYTIYKSAAIENIGTDGKKKYATAGVAIIIRNDWVPAIKEIRRYNERHIEIEMQNIVITNTYAPDMNKTIDERKNYWDKIKENIYTPKEKENKIHIWPTGNNGQIGTTRKNDKNIGKYTYKKISEQGNGKNLKRY